MAVELGNYSAKMKSFSVELQDLQSEMQRDGGRSAVVVSTVLKELGRVQQALHEVIGGLNVPVIVHLCFQSSCGD